MNQHQQDTKSPCGEPIIDDLVRQLHANLLQCSTPIGEYDLLQRLRDHGAFAHITDQGQLALFQQHFILMHALYRLRKALMQTTSSQPVTLHISALAIHLQAKVPRSAEAELSIENDASVAEYYLDWENYFATGAEQVQELIGEFWRAYDRYFSRDEALAILNLTSDADSETIAKRFRELASMHHPDRGGDKEAFIKIRAAYESLRV